MFCFGESGNVVGAGCVETVLLLEDETKEVPESHEVESGRHNGRRREEPCW